jgi:hypothetical protein
VRSGAVGPTGKQIAGMLIRLFRALMPLDERFIERFSEHFRLIVPAAISFRALMSGVGDAEAHAAETGTTAFCSMPFCRTQATVV